MYFVYKYSINYKVNCFIEMQNLVSDSVNLNTFDILLKCVDILIQKIHIQNWLRFCKLLILHISLYTY